jgi:DNA-binding response OmpR family regulator
MAVGRPEADISWTLNSCLVLEDDSIILIDIECTLNQLGIANIVSTTSLEKAVEMVHEWVPDFAVLDYQVGRGNSMDLARSLNDRNIPIVFLTAHGAAIDLPADLKTVPVVGKPFNSQLLSHAISLAMANNRSEPRPGDESA